MDSNFDFLDNFEDTLGTAPAEKSLPAPIKNSKKKRYEDGDLKITVDADEDVVTRNSSFQPYTPTEASYDPRMAFEIALGFEKIELVLERYMVTPEEWELLQTQPSFKKAVTQYQKDIDENGISFRTKARIQAEAYLSDAHSLIKHPTTPPSVKANMIQWITRVADLEPKKSEENQGTTFNLQINL